MSELLFIRAEPADAGEILTLQRESSTRRSRRGRNRRHLPDLPEVRRAGLFTHVTGSFADEDHQIVPSGERLGTVEEELSRTPDGKEVLLVLVPSGCYAEVARDGRRVLGQVTFEEAPGFFQERRQAAGNDALS